MLQALIELCVGNPPNQQVILEKQVVHPINMILQLGLNRLDQTGKVSGKTIITDDNHQQPPFTKKSRLLVVLSHGKQPMSGLTRCLFLSLSATVRHIQFPELTDDSIANDMFVHVRAGYVSRHSRCSQNWVRTDHTLH